MPCDQVLEVLWALIDGELDAEHSTSVDAHCRECAPCSGELRAVRSVKVLLSRSCACQPAPAGLRVRVVASIREVSVIVETTREPEK
jgi:mycothiol system anti-sigma-R factor